MASEQAITPGEGTAAIVDAIVGNVRQVIQGKDDVVALALVCLLAEGHLLVEDVPGVGKTSLAKALAVSIDAGYGRLQFTPDLLPADVVGVSVWNRGAERFEFRPGPVFTNILVADEINRASPKTQAALLEAMAEGQVTVDNHTRTLAAPFLVMATQNPVEHEGTFPLPESQLDRFAIVLTLGPPGREAEREVLTGRGGVDALAAFGPVTTPEGLAAAQSAVRRVHCTGSVVDYVLDVAAATREHPDVLLGASPRAALGLLHAAQAHATVAGRDFVSPDDVKAVTGPALAHRIVLSGGVDVAAALPLLRRVLEQVEAPRP
jgi:MoxR-like ATPase